MKLQASVARLILSVAVTAAAGCAGLLAPAPAFRNMDLSGQWTGTTSQGKPIAFTVKADFVTDFSVSYRLEQPGCEQDATDSGSAIKVQFEKAKYWSQSYQYSSNTTPMTAKIIFDFTESNTFASGTATWTANPSGASCSGDTKITWDARKQ